MSSGFIPFTVAKCPTNELSLTNCVILNTKDKKKYAHVLVENGRGERFVFTCLGDDRVPQSSIGFSMIQRKWAYLAIGQKIDVQGYGQPYNALPHISQVNFVTDYFRSQQAKPNVSFNSDQLRDNLQKICDNHTLMETQQILHHYYDYDVHLLLVASSITLNEKTFTGYEGTTVNGRTVGVCDSQTEFIFERSKDSPISLTGKSFNRQAQSNIINPDFDFQKLGIGGLDEEFKEIFRRAFASRVLPQHIIEKMGAKHVKGILLHGPPGCGKTLMARQIGNMLSAREPQIVNGPEILNKYVGESESNIRKLFEPAEEEQKKIGINSGLHIIIFDEIDAICKQRGSIAGASGVHDTVVNQLLSKIDGVEQLNNILVIGMTNRPDLIDEALLRPGRLEVKKEIGLPDEQGRLEILKIHTEKMKQSNMLHPDISLDKLASLTKNFSGAELAGLVGAAQSCAFVRHTKAGNKVEVDYDTIDELKVCMKDFLASLENDIKPAYGSKEEDVEKYMRNGIILWGEVVSKIQNDGRLLVNQVKNSSKTPLVSVILSGAPGSGKTALATKIACDSGFPFVKICSPSDLVGYSESAKCQHLKKIFDDSYKSQLSCVVVDDMEKLMDYNPIGPRFSNTVAQALSVLCKNLPPARRRLLIIATTSNYQLLQDMGLDKSFDSHINVPCCSTDQHIINVIEDFEAFDSKEREHIKSKLRGKKAWVGIKHLIRMIGTAEEAPHRASTFLTLLEEEAKLQ